MKSEPKKPDPRMDPAELYREEVFTDRKMGSIRRLTPVKPDGAPDPARKTVYVGEAQLMTSMGALPLNFEIESSTLDEAVSKYGPAVKEAFEQAMQELQEMRRRSSSLVIPESGASGLAGMGAGGMLPGSKLKLP